MIPKTLEECYLELDKMDGLDQWLALDEDDAIAESHFGVGRWLRNEWNLWKQEGELFDWFSIMGLHHPDDMSGVILTSYYRYKRNKPIELEEQIEHYIEYWLNDKEKLLKQRRKKLEKINK